MTGFTEMLQTNTEKYVSHVGNVAAALKELAGEMDIPLTLDVNAVAFSIYKSTKDSYGHAPQVTVKDAPKDAPKPAAKKPSAPSGQSEIIKLDKAGDEAYLHIQSVERTEGNFGPQVLFRGIRHGDNAKVMLYIGAQAVDRQFEFGGLDDDGVIGKTLRFFRKANPKGKAFWNIKLADVPAPTSNDFDAPPPPVEDDGFPF